MQPYFDPTRKTTSKKKWKTTSKKIKKNEDDLKKKSKNEDNLEQKFNFSQFLLNLGANRSWGWLSSLRFFLYNIVCVIKLSCVWINAGAGLEIWLVNVP